MTSRVHLLCARNREEVQREGDIESFSFKTPLPLCVCVSDLLSPSPGIYLPRQRRLIYFTWARGLGFSQQTCKEEGRTFGIQILPTKIEFPGQYFESHTLLRSMEDIPEVPISISKARPA